MIDPTTETWRTVAARAEEMLTEARTMLEEVETTPEETLHLRGMIAATKSILALASPKTEKPKVPHAALL